MLDDGCDRGEAALGFSEVGWVFEFLGDESREVRIAALKALVHLPLEPDVWSAVASYVRDRFGHVEADSLPVDRTELIEAAIYVPSASVRDRVAAIAQTVGDPDGWVASAALARSRDPRGAGYLVAELKAEDPAARALAAELLHRTPGDDIHRELRRTYRRDTDYEVKFWCALGLACDGNARPLRKVLLKVDRGNVPFRPFDGDYHLLMWRLHGYDDWDASVAAMFRELAGRSNLDGKVRAIIEALQEGPIESKQDAVTGPVDQPTAEEAAAAREIGTAYHERLRKEDPDALAEIQYDESLADLDPDQARVLVSDLIDLMDHGGDHEPYLAGNTAVELIDSLRSPFEPDVPLLAERFLRQPRQEFRDQLAWLASRASISRLVREIGQWVASKRRCHEKKAAADFLETTILVGSSQRLPIFGGGDHPRDVDPPSELWLEDGEPTHIGDFRLGHRRRFAQRNSALGGRKPTTVQGGRVDTQIEGDAAGQVAAGQFIDQQPTSVRLGVSAPPRAIRNSEFTARFVAYAPDLETQVREMLTQLSRRSAHHLGMQTCRWQPGTRFEVRLTCRHVEIDPTRIELVWDAKHCLADFDVFVPPDAPLGATVLRFDVWIAATRVARLRLDLEITDVSTSAERIVVAARPANSAFASYATPDRQRVLDRVSSLTTVAGIDVFLDVVSLRVGRRWKQDLKQEIVDRDLFLLFWSNQAAQSRWVDWEWHTALDSKGLDGIQPQPLEPVADAPPPDELAALHFGDLYMRLRNSERP